MPRKSRKNVGLIGLGIIGTRAAQGLRAAGYQVFVWNRTPKPAPNFLGSPAEVAEICDVIQLFIADSQALFEILDAFGNTLTANHVIACSATVGPEATLEAAKIVQSKGARFLDAPFTGSRGAAEKKQLVYYVGGDDTTFKKAEPFLKATSKAIVRCGAVGHAAVLKVVTNMITAVTTQTLAEALAIVKKSGLEPEVFAAALENNACRSGAMDMKLPKMVLADYEPHFSLKHMFKDVQLAIHMANALDIEVPATTVTAGVMYGALNNGWSDLDFSSVFKLYDGTFAAPPVDLAVPVAMPAQIEARAEPPSREEKPAMPPPAFIEAKVGTVDGPQPAPVEQPKVEMPPFALRPAETNPDPPLTPTPEGPKPESDANTMEVVKDVPKNAKPASDATAETRADEPKAIEMGANEEKAESGADDAENGADGTKKPFNRIKRFFFSPTGK